ncbi:hypothetical protein PRELSG_1020800 [Plasmodium relictum]|uniref:Uncharacterized protein n=1 Tax=Plasmodium relictum TaxID=85471 RepID=A0A1J1HAU0_PLARL|nr:hypothetical protein PRELSG_1020800 [Plasmodium relictum]CRH00554.1 hypothetical protein PRELSG_1020800 [Plasmodium relictum]
MNYNIYIGQLCVKPKIIKREILKDWRDCLNNLNNYENNYIATYDTNNVCSVIDSTFSNWNEIINNEDKFCLFKDSNMIILLKNVSSSKCTSTCLHEKKFSKWSNCIDLGKDSYQIRVKGILSKPYGLDKCLGTLEKKNCFSKEVVTGDFLNDTASCTFNFSLHLDRCSYICSGNNATIPHVFKILHNNVDKYGLSCPINEKIILIEFCKYCEKEKKKRNSSNNSKVSLVDLKRHEDFSINSSEKYKIQNMQKHFPLYIFSSDSKYDLNFNKNNYSFASLDSSTNNSDMVPMNFLISNSVINLTDDDYNKLMKEGSVKVYKDNELIDYKYEDFEIKDENKINEEDKVEDEDKDDSYDDIYNKGTISERLPADDYKVPKIYNKEGEIKNYVIIISVLLSLLLIIFIIYYFDLIQKFKRILSKKRKSNKSMTIAAEKSSGIYIDNAFAETTNV